MNSLLFRVKYLNIIRDEPPTNTTLPKITWCPYTPDDELDADKDMHLLSVSSVFFRVSSSLS